MLRLDKYLADMGIGARSQVKKYLRQSLVTVNGAVEQRPECKVAPGQDVVCFRGKPVAYEEFEYYMFHKPAGCVTAVRDSRQKTVMDFFPEDRRRDLFPVGRLDIDTEGLLLITDDGLLCHELLAPGKHVPKTYFARVEGMMGESKIACFAAGVEIGEERPTAPAKLEILSVEAQAAVSEVLVTITEGKFHQVKRMFEAVGSQVLYLKRISMGALSLDPTLAPGQYRRLTEQEIAALKK